MKTDFVDKILSFGASDCGFATVPDGCAGLPYAVSVAVRLSDAIIDEIAGEPTYTYFNHYRSVNALIDHVLLRAGLFLSAKNARWITVAASQSVPGSPFTGRYSHKKAAVLCGLGTIGKNSLFLHKVWGPRVRLGTLFTDWNGLENSPSLGFPDVENHAPPIDESCAGCSLCVDICPCGAIKPSVDGTHASFEAAVCSAWMKKEYQHIGRGVVCGLCVRVCPRGIPVHK